MTIDDRLDSITKDKIEAYKSLYTIMCAESCVDFINRYCFTYDPRIVDKVIPFILFPKQKLYIEWLYERYINRSNGAVDKCRDIGATWLTLVFIVWLVLFHENESACIYTYKTDECDKYGDISTLFGKVRFIIDHLPRQFTEGIETKYMYLKNQNGSDIAGASGENPGRGGRRSIVFKDESAFYEHPEMIEAAFSENSNCIIDVSTHQGTNTLFYQKVSSGSIPVFTFDWWDNPAHTQKWYDDKRTEKEAQGLLHVFQREIERNPGASVENVVIPPEFARAAMQDKVLITGLKVSGLDVADGGVDTNAQCVMDGNVLVFLKEWGDTKDVTETAEKAFWNAVDNDCDEFRYDNIGVGADVRGAIRKIKEGLYAKYNITEGKLKTLTAEENEKTFHIPDRDLIALRMKIIGWSASGKVVDPLNCDTGDKSNEQLFENAKSQAYWRVRDQLYHTYRFMNDKEHDHSKIISFSKLAKQMNMNKFLNEISQPQKDTSASGKIVINKKPKGTKSPNLMECFVIARAKIETMSSKLEFF